MSSNRDWVNQMSGDPDEATPASSIPDPLAQARNDALQ